MGDTIIPVEIRIEVPSQLIKRTNTTMLVVNGVDGDDGDDATIHSSKLDSRMHSFSLLTSFKLISIDKRETNGKMVYSILNHFVLHTFKWQFCPF